MFTERDSRFIYVALLVYLLLHGFLIWFIGPIDVFGSDEKGYLYTFNNLFIINGASNPQLASGWITAPIWFLKLMYSPAWLMHGLGLSSLVAIRLLSSLLMCFTLFLILQNITSKKIIFLVFLWFLIPSVVLWGTLGLRESFILFFLTLIFTGFSNWLSKSHRASLVRIFFGSVGLICTKNYLWVVCLIALVMTFVISCALKNHKLKPIGISILCFCSAILLYSLTVSNYALQFLFKNNIEAASSRSGDSISYLDKNGNYISKEDYTKYGIENTNPVGVTEVHGDYTLIAFSNALKINNASPLLSLMKKLHMDTMFQNNLNEIIVKADSKKLNPNSSHFILKPAKFGEPLSILKMCMNFVLGPYPILEKSSFALKIFSADSLFWWILYISLARLIYKNRRSLSVFKTPDFLFAFVFTSGFVIMSALVEVNAGTSFRHRSILLVPLVFIFVILATRSEVFHLENREIED